jgi:hypothetical protein
MMDGSATYSTASLLPTVLSFTASCTVEQLDKRAIVAAGGLPRLLLLLRIRCAAHLEIGQDSGRCYVRARKVEIRFEPDLCKRGAGGEMLGSL